MLPAHVEEEKLEAPQVAVARLARRPLEQLLATERFVFVLLDGALQSLSTELTAPVELCKDVPCGCGSRPRA